MSNIQSAKKDVRRIQKRNPQNSRKRARLRTYDKKIRALVQEGKVDEARAALKEYSRFLDRAGKTNLIHWKQADRRKSRMAQLIGKSGGSAPAAESTPAPTPAPAPEPTPEPESTTPAT